MLVGSKNYRTIEASEDRILRQNNRPDSSSIRVQNYSPKDLR
jgi:hypothetical protein